MALSLHLTKELHPSPITPPGLVIPAHLLKPQTFLYELRGTTQKCVFLSHLRKQAQHRAASVLQTHTSSHPISGIQSLDTEKTKTERGQGEESQPKPLKPRLASLIFPTMPLLRVGKRENTQLLLLLVTYYCMAEPDSQGKCH